MAGFRVPASGRRRSPGRSPGQPSRDGTDGPRPPRRLHGPAVDRRPSRRRRARHAAASCTSQPPGDRVRRPALRPLALGPSVVRRARRTRVRDVRVPLDALWAPAEVRASRGAGRRGAERGRRAGGGRGPPRPGSGRRSTRRSPTSSAAPAVAIGSRRSRRRSGCRHASCSAGPSTRSATARSCWRASCASATRWPSPGRGVAARRRGGALRLRRSGAPRRRRAVAGRHQSRVARPRGGGLSSAGAAAGRAANRSTALPSGSRTVA